MINRKSSELDKALEKIFEEELGISFVDCTPDLKQDKKKE
jgi:hypothetical protein